MSDPRVVLEYFAGGTQHVLDLPDAEHIHLTRRADGGWDAVPLEPLNCHDAETGLRLWVDVEGDDR